MQIEIPDDIYEEFQRLVIDRAFETTPAEYAQNLIRRELGQYNLLQFAEKDKLTDCQTRRQLDADLRHRLSSPGYCNTLTLNFMCYNISGFKKYNDTHGFSAGDKLLIQVADTLHKTHPNEPVYRVEGDSFIVISDAENPNIQSVEDVSLRTALVRITLPKGRGWRIEDNGAVQLYLYRGLSEAQLGGYNLTYNGERLPLA